MTDYFVLVISAIFVNNIILARFLGNCPFLGVSKKVDTAVGMGMAVVFVLTLAGAITWIFHNFILIPYKLEYLQTLSFILIIAALVQLVEMIIQKSSPSLYQSLGIYLPLITTNCAVLGVAIINIDESYNFVETVLFSFSSALGFALALFLFAGIRERLALSDVPRALEGMPIGLITAGLLSLAFMGFAGLV
ncbi:MAG: electron transport complex subunit RsxA [bacterium]